MKKSIQIVLSVNQLAWVEVLPLEREILNLIAEHEKTTFCTREGDLDVARRASKAILRAALKQKS